MRKDERCEEKREECPDREKNTCKRPEAGITMAQFRIYKWPRRLKHDSIPLGQRYRPKLKITIEPQFSSENLSPNPTFCLYASFSFCCLKRAKRKFLLISFIYRNTAGCPKAVFKNNIKPQDGNYPDSGKILMAINQTSAKEWKNLSRQGYFHIFLKTYWSWLNTPKLRQCNITLTSSSPSSE